MVLRHDSAMMLSFNVNDGAVPHSLHLLLSVFPQPDLLGAAIPWCAKNSSIFDFKFWAAGLMKNKGKIDPSLLLWER